jgi:hypothetical protein
VRQGSAHTAGRHNSFLPRFAGWVGLPRVTSGWQHKQVACMAISERMVRCFSLHSHAVSEVERREKVEEARRETERILAAQEAEVKARKAEMERRDK